MPRKQIFNKNSVSATIVSSPGHFTRMYSINYDEGKAIPDDFIKSSTTVFEQLIQAFHKKVSSPSKSIKLIHKTLPGKTNHLQLNITMVLNKNDFETYICQVRLYDKPSHLSSGTLEGIAFQTRLRAQTVEEKLKDLDEYFEALMNANFK